MLAGSPHAPQIDNEARPLRLSTHTTRWSVAQDVDQRRRVEPLSRVVVPAVDHLQRGPARSLTGPAGQMNVARRGHELQGWARSDPEARHAGPPGPGGGNRGRIPRRCGFLHEPLVVGVKHNEGGHPRARAPGGSPGADHHPGAGPGLRPVLGEQGHVDAPVAQCRATRRGPGRRWAPPRQPGRAQPRRAPPPWRCRRGAAAAGALRGATPPRPAARTSLPQQWTSPSAGPGQASPTEPFEGFSGPGGGGAGNRLTAVPGDAVTSNDRRRPAHRHAAHEARSINSGSGPQPVTFATGRNAKPSVGGTGYAVTHPRTFRPWSGTRMMLPALTSPASAAGTA